MNLPLLAPQLRTWFRKAFDLRERRTASNPANGGLTKAQTETFLSGKQLKSAEVSDIVATLTAD